MMFNHNVIGNFREIGVNSPICCAARLSAIDKQAVSLCFMKFKCNGNVDGTV